MSFVDRDRLRLTQPGPLVRAVVLVAVLGCVAMTGAAVLHRAPEPVPALDAGNLSGTWTEPQRPAVLFVGDSYTAGTGATTPDSGYACQTAAAMHWVCLTDAQGATGFINDGHVLSKSSKPFAGRIAADKQLYEPDVVVVDGGRNDGNHTAADVAVAAKTYLRRLHAAFPKAKLVLIAPAYIFSTAANDPYGVRFAADLRALGQPYHAVVIDPLAEDWFGGRDWHDYAEKDQIHPNQAGHDLITRRLVADLKQAGLGRLKAPARSF